jgi:oxygen-dependent protoporphyrinogen oxidase
LSRTIVIGGGIAGLAAAHRALELAPETEVLVLEGSSRVGGLLRTERTDDGFVIERGPDAILTEKPAALELAKKVGLEGQIVRTRPESRGAYVVSRGRLVRLPDGFSVVAPSDLGALLRSPVLSMRGKARAALEVALPRGASGVDESLSRFVDRRFGRELLERLAQPLAGGIYGGGAEELSLRATMPRFQAIEQSDRSVTLGLAQRRANGRGGQPDEAAHGARYGMFISFERGVGSLPEAVAERLGERVRMNARAVGLEAKGEGYRVELEGGESLLADAVVVALPAPRAKELLRGLDEALAAQLAAIRYDSAATVTFAYRREDVPHPLDAYGFVVPAVERRAVLASTWASEKWPGRSPDGMALLRVFLGGHGRPEAPFGQDDDLIAAARRELGALMGIRAKPALIRVDRFLGAMPRYRVGHLRRVATIERLVGRHRGLALAGGAYRGVGIPDSVRSGEAAATSLLRSAG